MAGGITKIESSNNLNHENDDDKGTKSSFADARSNSESTNPNHNTRRFFLCNVQLGLPDTLSDVVY